MIDINQLQFQRLDKDGLHKLVEWAQAEGWNPGSADADAFWATDPEGFYGYYNAGELVGGGSIISYNNHFGFMGFFIVQPEYRSNGIGRKLWYERRNKLIARLHPGASIGMDGVVDMQPFYEKGGFQIAFRDVRFQRIGEAFPIHQHISTIETSDFNTISAYDKMCFGFDRSAFLQQWLNLPNSNTFKYVDNGQLKGMAVIRAVHSGYKIGPLFADTASIAEHLYTACLNSAIHQPVFLDIPMINQQAVNLVETYQAKYIFECARMYYDHVPTVALDKIYGITTFELG